MRKHQLGRPSPAMVVACIALLVALGGTAIAAKKIGSSGLKKNAVKTKKIANQAVTKGKLADGAVSSGKLADAAVESNNLAQDAVATGKIQSDAVTQGKLATDSVGTAQLLADSVGTNKLKDAAVTGPKVANGSLGLVKVAAVVQEANPDPPDTTTGTCDDAPNVPVPGIQAGDSLLVLPKPDSASNADYAPIAGQIDPDNGMVNVVFCNGGADGFDPGPQRVTIVAFR